MPKPIAFCPHCASMREMDLSIGMMTLNNPNGSEEVFLFQYHCATCNTYVRSTSLDHQEIISPNAYAESTIPNYV